MMLSFDDVQAILQRHLPRASAGSPLTISTDGLQLVEPGVSVGDIAQLLADLSDSPDFLPAGLPVADIRLQSLSLERHTSGGADLAFTIAWEETSLSVADSFPLRLAKIDFSMRGGWLRAVAQAKFEIDGYSLDVIFELPSQVLELRLDPQQLPNGSAAFLAARGLAADSGSVKIIEMVLRGSLIFRSLLLHVELQDLFSIGPVHLTAATAEVVLAGDGRSSAAVSAELKIAIDKHPEIVIAVDGEVDPHGWRVGGSLQTTASLTIGDMVNGFASHFTHPAPSLPPLLSGLGLQRLAVALDTHDQSFSVDCTLAWQHDAEVVIHLNKQGDELLVTGSLVLDELVFKLIFDKAATTVVVGSFEAAGSKGLTLDQVLDAVSGGSKTALGTGSLGIQLDIRSLALALDDKARILVGAEVDAGIDLSRLGDLPLVGSLLPKGEPLGLAITPYYMADQFAAAKQVGALLPATLSLPETLHSGFHLAAQLRLGGEPITLDGFNADTTPSGAAAPAVAAPVAATKALQTDLTWKQVDKSLGPLKVGRVGYALDNKVLDLAIDASLEIGGLTVSVEGLGARYDANTRVLTPRLRGLGLDLRRGPLEIGGSFLNADGDFLGSVVISGETFSLNAIGAFKMVNGTPSMFAYGALDMPIGGPVFFFVEGLAAGFGLHRKIKMPELAQLRSFPLIQAAGVKSGGNKAEPGEELEKLHDFVTPKLGEYFFAAGIKFNSFRLLHGFVLLVVSAGRDLEIDVLGTADFSSPPGAVDENLPAMVNIELDLMARFLPMQGLLAVEANLNPRSYVYSPLCHLSGGFAFYAWMAGEHGGDFVLSVGGYHPQYVVPPHYPSVSRIELKFQVTPEVYLKGDAYFALTPSIMMAGGGLHADAKIGALHAWADLSVDFWVRWEPFHYDALVHVAIGAKWKCFHTTASADLHLWGPDFSGIAAVDWFVFSFEVAFGAQSPATPLPISLDKFKKSFLGIDGAKASPQLTASTNAILGVVVTQGLVGDLDGVPVVSPAELVIGTSSRVPVMSSTLAAEEQDDLDAPHGDPFPAAKLGILSAAIPFLSASAHDITVTLESTDAQGKVTQIPVSNEFRATPVKAVFPAALWAPAQIESDGRINFQADPNAAPIESISGFSLHPAAVPVVGESTSMRIGDLQYDMMLTMIRWSSMLFGTAGPQTSVLPRADLLQLGLTDADDLTDWDGGGRPVVQLGGGPMGEAIA